jgi:hypothetical protein
MKIINPGKIANHHAEVEERALNKTDPHVTTVGGTPKPKNDNADSTNTADAIPNAADTNTGASALGKTCLKIIRLVEKPNASAATMKS